MRQVDPTTPVQGAPVTGIGHNSGAVERSSFRAHCWRIARADLLGNSLPIEVVRAQVGRARDLGPDYKTYAGVRSTTGRDLVAFLYSSNALGVFRLGRTIPADRADRVAASSAVAHLGCAPGLAPDVLARQIGAVSAWTLPPFGKSWATIRDDMKAWLRAQGLPGDAVLMIGETAHEREMMEAGGLAGFVEGQKFFVDHAPRPHAPERRAGVANAGEADAV